MRDIFPKIKANENTEVSIMPSVRVAKELIKSPDFTPACVDYVATFVAVETFK